jgi:hypothetical protein
MIDNICNYDFEMLNIRSKVSSSQEVNYQASYA